MSSLAIRRGAAACAAALSALLPVGTAFAQAATYDLDPEHSFVQFEVMHFGTSTLRGRFGPLRGEVQIDPTANRGNVALRIPMSTLDTGVKVLDARLRQPDLLATEANPEAFFVASRFRYEQGRLAEVRGEFTLRGVSQPLSLVAKRFTCRTGTPPAEPAAEVCGGDFEGELRRSDFGATFGLPFVADRVRLLVQVEGKKR